MRRPELDYLLTTMLDSQPEVSDLLFTVEKPLQVESFGELKPVTCEPPIREAHALPDGNGCPEFDRGQPVAHRGLPSPGILRHRLHAHGQGPVPYQHLLAARQLLHRPAASSTPSSPPSICSNSRRSSNRFRVKRPAWCSLPGRRAPANPPPWPRSSTRSATPAGPHHHTGRPHRVYSSPRSGHVQPARIGHRFRHASPTACARPSARRPK